MPLFHHATSLSSITAGVLEPRSDLSDPDLRRSFLWWEREFGFYPLFLAVGRGRRTLEMTGYPNQFSRKIGTRFVGDKSVSILRKKGEIANTVLLSFEHVDGIAHNYDTWEYILCCTCNGGEPPAHVVQNLRRQAAKPLQYWKARASARSGVVQLCTSRLKLEDACRVWVRNQPTKRAVEALGYSNVSVVRSRCPKC